MKKLLTILGMILAGITTYAQRTAYPVGSPFPFYNGYMRGGYVMSDSALGIASKDTNWRPRYTGTSVFRYNSIWTYNTGDSSWKNDIQNQYAAKQPANSYYVKTRVDTFSIGKSPVLPFDVKIGNGILNFDGQTLGLNAASGTNTAYIGTSTGTYNTGSSNYGIGTYALQFGTGSHNVAIGTQSSSVLNGSGNVTVGDATGFTTDSSDNVELGYLAGLKSYPKQDIIIGRGANTTRVYSSGTINNTNIATGTVKIGGLTSLLSGLSTGFVGTLSITFNGTRPSVTGTVLSDDIGNKFTKTSTDTIALSNFGQFSAKGSGTMTVTIYSSLYNSVTIGYMGTADSSNQVSLGNDSTSQLKSNKIRIRTSVVPTEGQIFRYRGTEFVPESLPKIYTAQLNQTGTSAPSVVQVLENTLGSVPTFGYTGVGSYTINFHQTFADENKVTVEIKTTRNSNFIALEWNATGASLVISDPTDTNHNDLLLQAIVEIKYYP